MMAGGEQKPQPLGPDGKPVPDPVAEEKLRRKKIRTRCVYFDFRVAIFKVHGCGAPRSALRTS